MLLVTKPEHGDEPMTDYDFIIELYCRVDEVLHDVPKHPQANLYPSEVVTLGILFALKASMGERAFYRWLVRNFLPLFPRMPERTRLFRLFVSHQPLVRRFLAQPSLLGIADSYGIELIHPKREGRSKQQIGKKGKSNHRWIVGAKLYFILNHLGQVVDFTCLTANVYDKAFHPWIEQLEGQMVVFADSGFHAKQGDPANLKICPRGCWNGRMLVETVFSLLKLVCRLKQASQRVWKVLYARLGLTMAAFNLLTAWNGLKPDENGVVRLSMAEFAM
jgi:DDE family transposase